jgi:hypothetical protein
MSAGSGASLRAIRDDEGAGMSLGMGNELGTAGPAR